MAFRVIQKRYFLNHADNTMPKKIETQLREAIRELEFQKQAIDQHAIVSIADTSGKVIYANDKFCEVSQYSRSQLIGQNHRILKSGVHPPELYADMWHTISQGRVWKGALCNRKKDGSQYWVETTIMPFLDDAGLPFRYISIRTDISRIKQFEKILERGKEELEGLVQQRTSELDRVNRELKSEIEVRKHAEKKLEKLVVTDALTGIFNRRKFDLVLEQELKRADRYQVPLSLIMADIDHFKQINDSYGHRAGDAVLIQLTKMISNNIRESDVFARWGGEEFVVLTPNTDGQRARKLAEKLRTEVAAASFPGITGLTCSFGVTQWVEVDTSDDFINRVDTAMYQAKANGRNKVELLLRQEQKAP